MLQNLGQNFLSPNLQLDLKIRKDFKIKFSQERFQDQIFPPLDTQRCWQSVKHNSILHLMLMHRS